jgi:hypothetical protein
MDFEPKCITKTWKDKKQEVMPPVSYRPTWTLLSGCALGLVCAYHFLPWRFYFSRFLHWTKRRPRLSTDQFRYAFNEVDLFKFKPPTVHTHALAAADRSTAVFFVEKLASRLGLQPFYYQRSSFDERSSRDGSRSYFWAKDLTATPAAHKLPENPLLCMVDVDQYVDMPNFLSWNRAPVVLYTVQPTAVARTEKNYSFTFDALDNINYTVTGGGTFKHQIWNYSSDNLTVHYKVGGLPLWTRSYLIDRRSTSLDHEIILLTPIGTWLGLASLVHSALIDGYQLSRLHIAQPGGYARLMLKSQDGVFVSTGRVDQHLSTSIPAIVDDAIAVLARTSKYDLTLPQVQGLVEGEKERSIPLLDYHRHKTGSKPDVVCPVSEAVRHYQYQPAKFDPLGRPTLVAFMTPLLSAAFCPTRTKSNEEQCIEARVANPSQPMLEVSPFLLDVMREFTALVIPHEHKLRPVDYDEVLDRQDKPTQRRLFHSTIAAKTRRAIQMFLKAESYGNIKPPRAISVINPVDKRDYSCYMYSFESVLKAQPWYAFGLSPLAISERVAYVLRNALFATPTDFSKFDGHGSNIMRMLEHMLLARAFHPSEHRKIFDLHQSQFNLEAYGTYGTWYLTGYSRASGSPETSIFNTFFNAFVAYLARRMTKVGNKFMSPDMAFSGLGIYGGDDGLTADVDAKVYVNAAKIVGQELTIETIQRGKPGIKFLARVYSPGVWTGDISNCCDIPRQLSKLHTTVSLGADVTPLQKLREKVRSYSLTDPYTPIIGDFCREFLRFSGPIAFDEKVRPMATWLSKFDMEKQYRNHSAQWMDDYVAEALPDYDYKRFTSWLGTCKCEASFLTPPMCMEPPLAVTKVPVVIADEVLPSSTIVRPVDEVRRPSYEMVERLLKMPPTDPVVYTELLAHAKFYDIVLGLSHPPVMPSNKLAFKTMMENSNMDEKYLVQQQALHTLFNSDTVKPLLPQQDIKTELKALNDSLALIGEPDKKSSASVKPEALFEGLHCAVALSQPSSSVVDQVHLEIPKYLVDHTGIKATLPAIDARV